MATITDRNGLRTFSMELYIIGIISPEVLIFWKNILVDMQLYISFAVKLRLYSNDWRIKYAGRVNDNGHSSRKIYTGSAGIFLK